MKKISFYTFGCRLNQSETVSIQQSFKRQGYEVVGFDEPSDVVVVNTCTVTEGGDADTRHLVHKINRTNPSARIALVGCQAQIQKEGLSGLPNVRWIVGNGRKMDLPSVFKEHPDPLTPQIIAPAIEREAFSMPSAAVDHQHTRANLKIQDGCDFFCSFCEIPYARGRARSRIFDDIFTEARSLVEGGHQELVLTGINIGTYAYKGKNLMDVIKGLVAIENLKRLRISSIEPTTVPLDIFDLMGHKLCRYLHLPLQSGDDEILRAMKRKYTVDEFGDFIRDAKSKVPGICVGTDVIVGFPGETQEHFDRTAELIRELPIDYIHVFSYSPRHLAKSRLMSRMPPSAIAARSRVLRELDKRKRRLFHESMLGSVHDVLFERPKTPGWQNGLTDHFVRVCVKTSQLLFNQIKPVRLVSVDGQSMVGEILD